MIGKKAAGARSLILLRAVSARVAVYLWLHDGTWNARRRRL